MQYVKKMTNGVSGKVVNRVSRMKPNRVSGKMPGGISSKMMSAAFTAVNRGYLWVLLSVTALLLTGCHQPDPPEYFGYQNLQFVKGTGSHATVSALVKMYNPNPYHLKLRRAELDVTVNGKHAGHSLLDSTIFIPKRDTFYVPVSVDVDLNAVLSNALQLLVDPKANISLDGRVKVQKGILTFSKGFHYDGKQDIRALLDGGGL